MEKKRGVGKKKGINSNVHLSKNRKKESREKGRKTSRFGEDTRKNGDGTVINKRGRKGRNEGSPSDTTKPKGRKKSAEEEEISNEKHAEKGGTRKWGGQRNKQGQVW